MSITLGLNTALSGLLTNQRGLDVIAQNVVNVNTKGYVRKVMNPESRVLAGFGAGVQDGGVTRMVNEGLLKDIRKQTANMGRLETQQTYYPRIDDLFGEVGDNSSIAHQIQKLSGAFEALSIDANKPAAQWSTMQSGLDVIQRFRSMAEGLQGLRLEVDREIESTVAEINDRLNNIHDLNGKIIRNAATSTGTAELEDKRDLELNELSKLIDIQYFKRNDGATIIYTSAGLQLLDNQPSVVGYTANTVLDSWMTQAGGHFSAITVGSDSTDVARMLKSGKMEALITLRDKTIPDMQSEIDTLAAAMRDEINKVHNRGTVAPAIASTYTGTRTFATQGAVTAGVSTGATVWANGASANPGDLTFAVNAAGTTISLNAVNGVFTAANYPAGTKFTIAGGTANSGTYEVVTRTNDNNITIRKVNPTQTITLDGTGDVAILTFDSAGNQTQGTTLRTIMGGAGPFSIDAMGSTLQTWLQANGYANAVAGLDANGKFHVDLKTSNASLVFRDQVSGTDGAAAGDVTIRFDPNGDGDNDLTAQGFANFLGLNDFFVQDGQNMVMDSRIQSTTYTTTVSRTFRMLDGTGQLGNDIVIPANSSLQRIADAINAQTRTNDSVLQTQTSFTTTSAFTMTVSDPSGARASVTVPAGTVSLYALAGQLSTNGLNASVVQEGSGYRLRVTDSQGQALSVATSGGALSSNLDLGRQLTMTASQRVTAAVIPEGSGQRLRIVHSEGKEVFVSADPDGSGSLITDLGLKRAAVTTTATMDVRADIKTAPERISRGLVRWNADTGKYYMSEGDNGTALAMARAMTTKFDMDSGGGIFAGRYTFAEHSAASIGLAAKLMDHSKTSYEYQKTLNQSLDFQYSSLAGVNLDEEVANMINFQQAYSASAKVITVLQEMLETLVNIVR